MTGIEIWLIAVGLAMDCLAVSIASGIILKQPRVRPMLTMAFFFGFFQAAMPLFGWAGANTFQHHIEQFDHWITFCILAFLGVRMIREALKDEENRKPFNPYSFKVIITLAIATSIDALAIGVSFAFLGMNSFSDIFNPICIIGLVSFVLSVAGVLVGSYCGGYGRKIRVELWGGVILVVIGAKILIEHIYLQ